MITATEALRIAGRGMVNMKEDGYILGEPMMSRHGGETDEYFTFSAGSREFIEGGDERYLNPIGSPLIIVRKSDGFLDYLYIGTRLFLDIEKVKTRRLVY